MTEYVEVTAEDLDIEIAELKEKSKALQKVHSRKLFLCYGPIVLLLSPLLLIVGILYLLKEGSAICYAGVRKFQTGMSSFLDKRLKNLFPSFFDRLKGIKLEIVRVEGDAWRLRDWYNKAPLYRVKTEDGKTRLQTCPPPSES